MINFDKYLIRYRGKFRFFTKKCKENQKFIKIAAAVVVIAVAFVFFGDYGEKDKSNINVSESPLKNEDNVTIDSSKDDSKRPSKNQEIIVDISGCITNPGVYYVPSDSRLCDIIKLAGGLTPDADIDSINQAEMVSDGQKLFIPSVNNNQDISASSGQMSSASSKGKININTATFDELQAISGVGPATAASIVEYRTENGRFTSIDDIKNVSGIGEKTFEKLKGQITV